MSSNDFIEIDRQKFTVRYKDADRGFLLDGKTHKAKSLEEAINIADKIIEDYGGIEYGIWFVGKKEEDNMLTTR